MNMCGGFQAADAGAHIQHHEHQHGYNRQQTKLCDVMMCVGIARQQAQVRIQHSAAPASC
jgi:hypothetical protein